MIDCVMGAAVGYNEEQIRPFLKSLRMTGYDGHVILFADKGAAVEARKWEVEVLPVPKVRTLPHAERFYWLLEKLSTIECAAALCLDTRDVIFQSDPSFIPSVGLHVFEEDNSMTMGSCPYNSEWIKIGYGEEVFGRMKDFPISCVGSFCGSKSAVVSHLTKLTNELQRLQPKTKKPQDQSCHNYFVRILPGEYQRIWRNEEGPVYTVGYIPRETVKTEKGFILNQLGHVPPIIHQWERHQNLTTLVHSKYL